MLSDLHANPFALDAVLADLPRDVDAAVCLGDVAIGPFPNEVIWRLRELDWPVVMGTGTAGSWTGCPRSAARSVPDLGAGPVVRLAVSSARIAPFCGASARASTCRSTESAACSSTARRARTPESCCCRTVARRARRRARRRPRRPLPRRPHASPDARRRPDSLFANVGSVGLPSRRNLPEVPCACRAGRSTRSRRWTRAASPRVPPRPLRRRDARGRACERDAARRLVGELLVRRIGTGLERE